MPMDFRRTVRSLCLLCTGIILVMPYRATGQDDHHRGRKYKAPPDTSHIEVEVLRSSNGKPISNAAIVFNPEKDGKDEGSLEVKTGPDGKASIDVIPTGSKVTLQVIADGFATYAEEFVLTEPSREISIKMLRPRAQVSTYQDNSGKAADRKAGVQEPIRPKPNTASRPGGSPLPADTTTPGATTTPAPDSTTPTPAPPTKPNT